MQVMLIAKSIIMTHLNSNVNPGGVDFANFFQESSGEHTQTPGD